MLKKPKVLIVDDDPILLKLLSNHLETDYDIATAEDGASAWKLLTESVYNFSVIIADRMMPKMDGIQLTREIRKQPAFKDIPVIMLTSAAEKDEVIAAIQGGVYDFLMKPIETDLLKLVVKRAINSRYEWI